MWFPLTRRQTYVTANERALSSPSSHLGSPFSNVTGEQWRDRMCSMMLRSDCHWLTDKGNVRQSRAGLDDREVGYEFAQSKQLSWHHCMTCTRGTWTDQIDSVTLRAHWSACCSTCCPTWHETGRVDLGQMHWPIHFLTCRARRWMWLNGN